MHKTILDSLQTSMGALDQNQTLSLVKEALNAGVDPHAIADSLGQATKQVGKRYSKGEYFIPELIFCGQIFGQAMEILAPVMPAKNAQKPRWKYLIGTVKGDLHDLGVKLVSLTLTMDGFEVVNLGKDVPAEMFIAKVKELKPDILGLSALLTTTLNQQKEVIEGLKKENVRKNVKIMIGGAPVTQEWANAIGADAVGFDAIDALGKAKNLLGVRT